MKRKRTTFKMLLIFCLFSLHSRNGRMLPCHNSAALCSPPVVANRARPPEMAARALTALARGSLLERQNIDALTERERDVLALLA